MAVNINAFIINHVTERGKLTVFKVGRCPLVERSLGLDKITKTKKAWIMVNNVYCSTCELRSLFCLTFIACSSNLRLRSAGCGLPFKVFYLTIFTI